MVHIDNNATAFFVAFQSMVKQAVTEALADKAAGAAPASVPDEIKPPATRAEAAKFLNISLPTLDVLVKTEQIRAFNIGRSVRITWAELERYVADRESQSTGRAK